MGNGMPPLPFSNEDSGPRLRGVTIAMLVLCTIVYFLRGWVRYYRRVEIGIDYWLIFSYVRLSRSRSLKSLFR
jgi:hypothetical protein